MATGINISLSEVSAVAATIRAINSELTQGLEEIKADMNALESTWQSESSRTIIANMNAMGPKFSQYQEIVESYSRFLDATVTSYSETETTINSNANAFK